MDEKLYKIITAMLDKIAIWIDKIDAWLVDFESWLCVLDDMLFNVYWQGRDVSDGIRFFDVIFFGFVVMDIRQRRTLYIYLLPVVFSITWSRRNLISDDYMTTSKQCPDCKHMTMQVVRPGKVQCGRCH